MEDFEDDKPPSPQQVSTAWRLGIAGLIPFLTIALLLPYLGKSHGLFAPFADAFKLYAAVILSFIGGVRWGLALRDSRQPIIDLVISVVPAIIGWIAV